MLLGYNVGFNFGGELGRPPEVSFWVRRFDQSPETRQTFVTVEQASKHLDDAEKLQVYCLALVGNPRIEVVTESDNDGKVTWIADTETGHVFGVRTFDLEAETQMCIHAETPPTIGNWEPASDS